MCYKDEDEELWQEDPYEYIRMKFGNLALFLAFIIVYPVVPVINMATVKCLFT